MTEEKKLDREYNKIYLEYRKYLDKNTCPWCNLPEILQPIRMGNEFHDPDNCFRCYVEMLHACSIDPQTGKMYDPETLRSLVENGLRKLKSLDKKFTENQA